MVSFANNPQPNMETATSGWDREESVMLFSE